MPTYEYACDQCGHTFERFQKFSEEPVKECPCCQGPVRRVIHPTGIIFKGSGWYTTDYARKSASLPSKPEKSTDTESSKTETKASTTPKLDTGD